MTTGILLTAATCLTIVLVAMGLLAGVTECLRRLGQRGRGASVATSSTANGPASPHLIAVIAAAATEALGAPVVVRRVHMHAGADSWSRAGRMDIMDSHRIGPRR
jgi:hypothetical protein